MLAATCLLTPMVPAVAAPAKGGTTLSGTVAAAAVVTSEYDWSLSKSVNRSSATIGSGATEQLTYSLTAGRTLKASPDTFKVAGQVCVQNGGEAATTSLQITAVLQRKIGSGKFQDLLSIPVAISSNPVLDPRESACYAYEATEITRTAGAAYRVVANITIMNHSGSIGKAKGPSPAADFSATPADATATVVDVPGSCTGFMLSGGLAPWTIQEADLNRQGCATRSFTVAVTSSAGCGASCSLVNTATLTEGTNTGQQRTATATVSLNGSGAAPLLQQCLSRSEIVAAIVDVPGLKSELLNLINAYRSGLGLRPLQRVQILENVAQSHSGSMSCIGLLSHDINGSASERIYRAGYDDQAGVGETIAQGQTTPQQVLDEWKRSSAHNAVLTTAALTQVGLGLRTSVSESGVVTLWWTADFGSSSNTYSSAVPGTAIDRESAATELIGLLQAADAAYCAGNRDQYEPGHFGPIFVEFVRRFDELGLTDDCNLRGRVQSCLSAVLAGLTFPATEFSYTGYLNEVWGIAS